VRAALSKRLGSCQTYGVKKWGDKAAMVWKREIWTSQWETGTCGLKGKGENVLDEMKKSETRRGEVKRA